MHSCPVQLTMTALHEAAITGKVDTVKFLVSRFNADLEARDGVSVPYLRSCWASPTAGVPIHTYIVCYHECVSVALLNSWYV